MPDQLFDHEIDTRGLVCPEPLMRVRNKIRAIDAGETLHILATDPTTERDFTNFCRFMGHTLEYANTNTPELEYVIRKGSG